jgi:hypothetical protein
MRHRRAGGRPMTWVIGGAGLWSPFIAGDICVTWRHAGRDVTKNCLQKIYPVSENILGGFAGSVSIGFDVLSEIRKRAVDARSLRIMARTWLPRLMRYRFNLATDEHRKHRSQILLVGYHPDFELAPNIWQVYAFRFSSPRFEPVSARRNHCLGIGSGQAVEELRLAMESAHAGLSQSRMNAGNPYFLPQMMAARLRELLLKNPQTGVSEWFVYGTVMPQGLDIQPFSCNINSPTGVETIAAPPIARSAEEFRIFAAKQGLRAEAATA